MIHMKNKIIEIFKNLDSKTIKIIKNGLKFCTVICAIALAILLMYTFTNTSPIIYEIGIILFKTSLLFSVEFLICGIVVDSLKKEQI